MSKTKEQQVPTPPECVEPYVAPELTAFGALRQAVRGSGSLGFDGLNPSNACSATPGPFSDLGDDC